MDFSDVAVGWEPSLYYLQPFCPGFHISLHHFFPICLTENLRTKGFTQYLQTIKNCMLGQLPRILLLYTGSRPVILHETSQRFLYFIPIRHKTRFAQSLLLCSNELIYAISPADQFLVFVLLLFLKLSQEMLNNFLLDWHVLECFVASRAVIESQLFFQWKQV